MYQRRGGEGRCAERRHSWEAGGSAFDGQDPPRKTRSQAGDIAPQLHPAVTGVGRRKGQPSLPKVARDQYAMSEL